MLYLKQSIFSYSPKWYRAKFQVGFYQLYLSLFTLCAVKGFMWFRVLMTKTRGNWNPDMSRKRTVHQRNRPGDHLQMHLYTFLHRKRMYSHLYRGVGLCLLSQEGTSFSITNWILLALMHVCICTLIHTVHTLLGAQQTSWGGGRGTEWTLGQCRFWQIKSHKICGNEFEIKRPHAHFRTFHKNH